MRANAATRQRPIMLRRNILILTTCQLISATGAIIMVTLGGIIGTKLATDPTLATLPVSIMVLTVAATAIPATMLMRTACRRLHSPMHSPSCSRPSRQTAAPFPAESRSA